jgi:hypothetical protein
MIRIRLPDSLPPEIEAWKVRALEITDLVLAEVELEERHRLISRHEQHWRNPALVKWLSDLSYEKCWYTETKFGGDYQEVEHFRPKKGTKVFDGSVHETHSGYYWLAFDLNNYRLCKRRPNAKKSTFFPIIDERHRAECQEHDCEDELPLFLDPLSETDCLLISFNDDGTPCPESNVGQQDEKRVNFTIDKYFLDERILNIRRAEVWGTARDLFKKYQNKTKDANSGDHASVTKRSEAKSDLKELLALLSSTCEFSSVARTSLIKLNDISAYKVIASAK